MKSKTGLIGLFLVVAAAGALYLYLSDAHDPGIDEALASTPADARILMVGNSLTYCNDLDQVVGRLAASIEGFGKELFVLRIASTGYRMTDHARNLFSRARETALRQVLLSGAESMRTWDYVVLQDQSQILGRDVAKNPSTRATVRAAKAIHKQALQAGATGVLMMTWGFWDGDHAPKSRKRYPDFPTMSRRIEDGYRYLSRELSASKWRGAFDGARRPGVQGSLPRRAGSRHRPQIRGVLVQTALDGRQTPQRYGFLSGGRRDRGISVRCLGRERTVGAGWARC